MACKFVILAKEEGEGEERASESLLVRGSKSMDCNMRSMEALKETAALFAGRA
jgi:hypothetical protein